jgi:hypothetical protein
VSASTRAKNIPPRGIRKSFSGIIAVNGLWTKSGGVWETMPKKTTSKRCAGQKQFANIAVGLLIDCKPL